MVLFTLPMMGWGAKGHDAIAYIAECHLKPEAKAKIEKYLDNKSIVYYASWLDYVRPEAHYSHTGRWHTYRVDSLCVYHPHEKRDNPGGIEETLAKLRDYKNQPDSAVADDIKILVHLVGDLHCPCHAYFDEYDQWGITINLNGTETNVHHFWDTVCLAPNNWNYLEFQHQLDRYSDEEIDSIVQGTPQEWAGETGRVFKTTHDWFEDGDNFNHAKTLRIRLDAVEIAHPQIAKAGYRLAHLLNEIFAD